MFFYLCTKINRRLRKFNRRGQKTKQIISVICFVTKTKWRLYILQTFVSENRNVVLFYLLHFLVTEKTRCCLDFSVSFGSRGSNFSVRVDLYLSSRHRFQWFRYFTIFVNIILKCLKYLKLKVGCFQTHMWLNSHSLRTFELESPKRMKVLEMGVLEVVQNYHFPGLSRETVRPFSFSSHSNTL